MAKRKSATTERSGAEANTPAAQETLPGMAASEPFAETPAQGTLLVSRRGKRGAALEVALRVAPSNRPSHPPRARQQPAAQPTAPDAATPAAAPKRPHKSAGKRFGDLRDALAEGWEIVQPIFARPLWSAADDSQTAFNFVLRRDQATRLLTVPGSRTVERFIAAHSLQVDYRR